MMLKEKHGILTYIVSVNGWLVLTHDSFKKKKKTARVVRAVCKI